MKHVLLWTAALSFTLLAVGCDSSVTKLNDFVDSADDPRQLNVENLDEVFAEGAIANRCASECMDAVVLYAALRKFDEETLAEHTLEEVLAEFNDHAPAASTCHDKLTLYSDAQDMPTPLKAKSNRKEMASIAKKAIQACAKPATR